MLCILFSADYVVIEGCMTSGIAAQPSAYPKDGNSYWSVRNNDLASNYRAWGTGCQISASGSSGNIEAQYNKCEGDVRMNVQAATTSGEHWFQRNSVQGNIEVKQPDNENTGPYYIDNNAHEAGAIDTGTQIIPTGTEVTAASGVFDASLDLTETYAAYLGTRGAQVI
jgi:hypothetical protein